VNKTNRCTEFKFYCYYDSTCFGQPFCSSSWVLSRTSVLVHFMQFHPTPGSNQSSQLHKIYQSRCTAKNFWWWAERLPETCRVVTPIKLEFSASVGLIHKESVTMHGHTILKFISRLEDVRNLCRMFKKYINFLQMSTYLHVNVILYYIKMKVHCGLTLLENLLNYLSLKENKP
jgi:hypothetical protein